MPTATIMDAFNAAAGFTNQVLGVADQLKMQTARVELERINYNFDKDVADEMQRLNNLESGKYEDVVTDFKDFHQGFWNEQKKNARNNFTARAIDSMRMQSDAQLTPQVQALAFKKEVDYQLGEKTNSTINIINTIGKNDQDKINKIENIWFDAYQKGYISYERLQAAVDKYSSEAVFQNGISQIDNGLKGFEASKDGDGLEKWQEAEEARIDNMTLNTEGSLQLRIPGQKGGIVPRHMDLSKIKAAQKEYLQRRVDGIFSEWQKENIQTTSERYTALAGLNPAAPNYVALYNSIVAEAHADFKRWNKYQLSAEQEEHWAPKFRYITEGGRGSGSGGRTADEVNSFAALLSYQYMNKINNEYGRPGTSAEYTAGILQLVTEGLSPSSAAKYLEEAVSGIRKGYEPKFERFATTYKELIRTAKDEDKGKLTEIAQNGLASLHDMIGNNASESEVDKTINTILGAMGATQYDVANLAKIVDGGLMNRLAGNDLSQFSALAESGALDNLVWVDKRTGDMRFISPGVKLAFEQTAKHGIDALAKEGIIVSKEWEFENQKEQGTDPDPGGSIVYTDRSGNKYKVNVNEFGYTSITKKVGKEWERVLDPEERKQDDYINAQLTAQQEARQTQLNQHKAELDALSTRSQREVVIERLLTQYGVESLTLEEIRAMGYNKDGSRYYVGGGGR